MTSSNTDNIGYIDPTLTAINYCTNQIQVLQQQNQQNDSNSNQNEIVTNKIIEQYEIIIQTIQSKLWHQCTVSILQYIILLLQTNTSNDTTNTTTSISTSSSMDFYYNVIQVIQHNIHPLAYARMTSLLMTQYHRSSISNSSTGVSTTSTSTTSTDGDKNNTNILQHCYDTLKEQQQQVLDILKSGGAGNSGSTGTSSSPSRRNNNTSNTTTTTTPTINYGTPTSYVEALLFIQCQQSIITLDSYTTSTSNTSSTTSSSNTSNTKTPMEMKLVLRPIYQKIIQPNQTIVQDLISMTTSSSSFLSSEDSTNYTSTQYITDLYHSTIVYSAYYEMTMKYYHYVTPYTHSFFDHAIQYLQYNNNTNSINTSASTTTNTTTILPKTIQDHMNDTMLAIHICWSAILGEGIYNLSYIIEHPFILQQFSNNNDSSSTSNTNLYSNETKVFVWNLLNIIAQCNYDSYIQLMSTTVPSSTSSSSTVLLLPQTVVPNIYTLIHEKFILISLLHIITTTTTSNSSNNDGMDTGNTTLPTTTTTNITDRCFTFDDLKIALHLSSDNNTTQDSNNNNMMNNMIDMKQFDIEMILMRAISIGLIRGTIDEILQTITITYIQPQNTLTNQQISFLLQQYINLNTNIQNQIHTLQQQLQHQESK